MFKHTKESPSFMRAVENVKKRYIGMKKVTYHFIVNIKYET